MLAKIFFGTAVAAALCIPTFAREGSLETGDIGDLRLENGEVLRDCRIAYRTYGTLNTQRSNVVVFPTWLAGTTELLAPMIGPGKLVDSSRFYVVTVEALGNGVSSSPSNSPGQSNLQFPHFSIRDMVASQHQLLMRVLKINHVLAVIGLSMGGMQTFQWMVEYPEFMDKAVPIIGTPYLTSYDMLLWEAERAAMAQYLKLPDCCKSPQDAMRTVALVHALATQTPHYWVKNIAPNKFAEHLRSTEKPVLDNWNIYNYDRQLEAILGHNVARAFHGSPEAAAAVARAKALIVVSDQDHMVNPEPALDFARMLHAPVTHLDSDCGHVSFSCNSTILIQAVAAFLKD